MAAHPAARGAILALLAACTFGLVSVVAKETTLHPLALAGSTYLLAGLVLLPTVRGFRATRHDVALISILGVAGGFLAPTALYYGLDHANAADASLLLTLEMAFTTLLAAVILRERVKGRAALGMILLFGAALLVASAGLLAPRTGGTSLVGVLLVVASTLGWSIDNLAGTHLTRRHDARPLVALKGLLGGTLCLVAFVATQPAHHVTWRNAGEVAFIGLSGIALSTILLYRAFPLLGATRAIGIFVPGVAVSGALAGAFLLHEPLGWPHAAALLLVVAGVAALTAQQKE